jgi:hypothetical protein
MENPHDASFLRRIPLELLQSFRQEKVQMHYHNWAVTTEFFNSCKHLNEFWDILAVDDGLPQGHSQNEGVVFKEFVLGIQAKNYPIHAWLTHPESGSTIGYTDPDPKNENPEIFIHKDT